MPRLSRCTRALAVTGLAVTGLAAAAGCTDSLGPAGAGADPRALSARNAEPSVSAQSKGLRKAITAAGVRVHQAAFQAHADANGGVRRAGSPGYDASAHYVRDRLAAAGYAVTVQELTIPFSDDRTPPVLDRLVPAPTSYVDGVDFATLSHSGSGDVTAPVHAVGLMIPVPPGVPSTSGCEAAHFAGFPAGAIALVQRGDCAFRQKAQNAAAAGAVGVIIMNDGAPGRTGLFDGTLGEPQMPLPAVEATFALGNELRNAVSNGPTGTTVRLRTDVLVGDVAARNIVAESPAGDPDRVVLAGARLDGGARGPGINQTSGAAAMLHIAEVFAAQERNPRNRVRFVWFAGLAGSQRYVEALSAAERGRIAAVLGLDALGSPNFGRFVYDGDNSDFAAGGGTPTGPAGSGTVEALFTSYFAAEGLAAAPAPLSTGWEHASFAAAGIPVGGLFAGTTGIKSAAEAAVFGGTPGVAFDPCFDLGCDTFPNTSLAALDQMSDASVHVLLLLSKRNFGMEPLHAP